MRPLPLQNEFVRMARDFPRNRMPQGAVWNLLNYLPGFGAPLRERGPWTEHSGLTTSVTANGSYIQGGVWATFAPTSGPNRVNVAIDDNGNLYTCNDSGTLTRIGALSYTALDQKPVFMGGTAASAATAVFTGLVIIPQGSGAVPQKFNGTTLAALGGSPPQALFAGVYKDYLLLGNGTQGGTEYPNRVWFSPPGDPDCAVSGSVTAWDVTDSWIDFNDSVFGFGSTPNALIVFHRTGISRVRGSIAPPEEDMIVDHLWHQADLLSPFSIVEHDGYVYWVSTDGVFRTDGVTVENLTQKSGMSRYWNDLVVGTTKPNSWRVSAGILRDHMFVQVGYATATTANQEIDGFLINLSQYAWGRISNLRARAFWSGQINQAEELFFGSKTNSSGIVADRRRICKLSTVFIPQVTTDTGGDFDDAEDTDSVLETPFYELGRAGLKRMKRLFVGYDLKRINFAAESGTVSYVLEPGDAVAESDYTSIGTIAETSAVTGESLQDYERVALPVNRRGPGIGFRFVRGHSGGDFAIHDLGLEVHHQEESKRE